MNKGAYMVNIRNYQQANPESILNFQILLPNQWMRSINFETLKKLQDGIRNTKDGGGKGAFASPGMDSSDWNLRHLANLPII